MKLRVVGKDGGVRSVTVDSLELLFKCRQCGDSTKNMGACDACAALALIRRARFDELFPGCKHPEWSSLPSTSDTYCHDCGVYADSLTDEQAEALREHVGALDGWSVTIPIREAEVDMEAIDALLGDGEP